MRGWAAHARLPEFPWDQLAPYGETARAHPDGIVDLSIGTPVDSTPEVVQAALRGASDAPGYPATIGSPALRQAVVGWAHSRLGATVTPAEVVPSIGSKELVALLAQLLAIHGRQVLIPALAYPTYDVGARLARCTPLQTDDPTSLDPKGVGLVWLNSPSNPTGEVLTADRLRRVVDWARTHRILVASDECYLELGWEADPVSVLHPSVSGGTTEGLLALHSLSKRSNLAGYRSGFALGDPDVVGMIVEARKHIGLLPPAPVQAATVAALADDVHVTVQRERYRARRQVLRDAVLAAGFRVDHSEAGLYLWLSRDEDCWRTVAWFADRGILVAPGAFYGQAGRQHVRMALTATDERVAAAAARLT